MLVDMAVELIVPAAAILAVALAVLPVAAMAVLVMFCQNN